MVISLIASLLAVGIASFALLRPFIQNRSLRLAFRQLETEYDDLRDEVKVALGRMSRLKGIIAKTTQPEPGSEETPEVPEPGSSLTPRQRAIQARILERRMKV